MTLPIKFSLRFCLLLLTLTKPTFAWFPSFPASLPLVSKHSVIPAQAFFSNQQSRHIKRIDFALLAEATNQNDDVETLDLNEIANTSLDVDSLMEMDCFIFSRNADNGENKKLELGVLEESVLQPICAWTTDEAFDDYIEFVVDEEDRYTVDLKDVTVHALIPGDALSFGSRQVGGGKGPGNPHGEESELLYYIRKPCLEGLEVVVKPELEITW